MKDGHRSACKNCERSRTVTTYKEKYVETYTRINRERGHVPLEDYLEKRRENTVPVGYQVAKRRAKKKKATPSWDNEWQVFAMQEAYRLARQRTDTTNVRHEVDHIVPLQHNKVCGLHVIENLQVIPAFVNRTKSNKFKVA